MEMVMSDLNLNKFHDAYRGTNKGYDSDKNGFASNFSITSIAGAVG